ncbi:hypothetical protein BW900_24115 [Bacillus mycoides]|uniref:Uncharacterized protein n=1 Tax=Bacillus mycoides TaxID=1405 RepID=A0A1S9T2U2_BACMY|nr:hypothetical protein [Bacillus mycoides]OOR03971.1 hypothetical protein BW900_24115 [Bacillus mycoides]
MGKLARVRLHGIYCETEGPDPGANLEVYGWLMANTDTVPFWMWSVGDNDGVNISRNSTYHIGAETTVHVRNGQNLYIGGELWDDDEIFNPDDYLGANWRTIPLDEITPWVKNYEIWFEEDGQRVRVDFSVIEELL